MLHEFFEDRIIARGLWPPRSSDMTPPDFFLCSYLKNNVYFNNRKYLDQLKANITEQIAQIDEKMLKNVCQNMIKRVQMRKIVHGGQFQHLL